MTAPAPTPWTDFVLVYEGNDGRDTLRPARVIRRPDGLWVIVTEVGEGTTTTNAQAAVWRAVRRRFPDQPFRVLEHWPAGAGVDAAEHWDELVLGDTSGHVFVFWYQRWPAEDVRLFFAEAAPFGSAHQAVQQPVQRAYTALSSHMRALRRRTVPAAPPWAPGSVHD